MINRIYIDADERSILIKFYFNVKFKKYIYFISRNISFIDIL